MRTPKSAARIPQMKLAALAVMSCFASGAALANPNSPTVAHGNVSFSGLGTSALTITNNAAGNAIINWNGFSIGMGELTRFQQFANLAVLNRVTGSELSSILGQLRSDGRVFLINPNGIVFGGGAVVDVAGLVASSLNLSDADFLAGNYRFQPVPGAGSVVNGGFITTHAGGQVYLVGPAVSNGGVITSPQGEVILAAGNSVELMNTGTPGLSVSIEAPVNEALNLGQIYADSGRVGIFAGLINQRGIVSARTAVVGVDGSIRLQATESTVFAGVSNTYATGALDIDTGDLTVAGYVQTGPQTIDVRRGMIVQNEPGVFTPLFASGGQTINAGFVEVNGVAGGQATIANTGGLQSISTFSTNASGDGLVVRSAGGAGADISNAFGDQRIQIHDAQRAMIDGATGFAAVGNFGGGVQTFSLSGPGANALVMRTSGDTAGAGGAFMSGDVQTIVAGNPGEAGSIALYGPSSQIISNSVLGGTQTITTSGALSLSGSDSTASQFPAGFFAQGVGGLQTVRADSILLRGGSGGNGATITAFNGSQRVEAGAGGITLIGGSGSANGSAVIEATRGSQQIDAGAGGITLIGGASGDNNFVQINQRSTDPSATQTLTSAGPVLVEGGSGNFNFALIRAFGGHQSLTFGETTLLAGAGGIDNFSVILGRNQDMTVHGNLALVARGSAGSPTIGGGVRIGGIGGGGLGPTPTDLRLHVDGDFSMTAGSVAGTGTMLGNTANFTGTTDVSLFAGGDVSLSGGTAEDTYSLIGSRASNLAGGNINISANGDIALNSTAPERASIIRTSDGVSLSARQISQGPDSRVQAGSLTVNTQQGAALAGNNSVGALNMLNSTSGNVAFDNTSALLTVTGIDQVRSGALALNQAGNLRVNGDVSSGAQTIGATGDMTVTPGTGPNVTVNANGAQTFNVGGSFGLLGGTAWNGYAQTLAKGPVRITTGGDLDVRGGSGLLAYALLYGGDDIRLTVGGQLHVDGGRGLLAFARVQTDLWDRIFLDFPNRASGGYFVNGREGVSNWGFDGFFTGFLPARRGRSLIVSYGE